MSTSRVICAGFGGQGVMSMGQLLTYAGMLEGKEVAWLPSYGPEMRGGTANCAVTVSDDPVGSPVIANDATCAVIMNLPSMKFVKDVVPGGHILVNSSLIDTKVDRDDVKVKFIGNLNNNRYLKAVVFVNKQPKFIVPFELNISTRSTTRDSDGYIITDFNKYLADNSK